MTKGAARAVFSAMLVVVVVVCVGTYSAWRDCSAVGGTTVRGLFGLECIRCTLKP